jgi:hypothetical protein
MNQQHQFLDLMAKLKAFVLIEPPVRWVYKQPADDSPESLWKVHCVRKWSWYAEPGTLAGAFELGPFDRETATYFVEFLSEVVDKAQMEAAPAMKAPIVVGEELTREFDEIGNWIRSPFFSRCLHNYKKGPAFRG